MYEDIEDIELITNRDSRIGMHPNQTSASIIQNVGLQLNEAYTTNLARREGDPEYDYIPASVGPQDTGIEVQPNEAYGPTPRQRQAISDVSGPTGIQNMGIEVQPNEAYGPTPRQRQAISDVSGPTGIQNMGIEVQPNEAYGPTTRQRRANPMYL